MKYRSPELNLHRVYVASAYHTDKGTPARLPDTCPYGLQDGSSCKISLNHKRVRATGPSFVYVAQCQPHHKAFSIYPPGYAPYGRKAIVGTIAPDGNLIILDGDDALEPFRQTIFDAVADAANDKIWSHSCHAGPENQRFSTQLRQVIRSVIMLGLSPEQVPQRSVVTEILNVPGQLLHENAGIILDQKSTIRDAGQAVCNILEKLSAQAQAGINVFLQLAICGHLAGLWPPLHWWCPKAGKLLAVDKHNLNTLDLTNIST